jgi:hypothetical protein
MKTKFIFIFTFYISINIYCVKAQTVYVPGGTGGIGNNTLDNNVGVGTSNTRGDKFHVSTGGQFFRAATWGIGIADAGWRNTLVLSNLYSYSEVYNNDGKPIVFQVPNGGNIGIGTNAPLYKLDIDNAKYGSGQIRWRANGGGTSAYGFTYADQAGVGITNADPYSELLYLNTSDHSVSLYSSGLHRFIISSNGNVGIGTSTPSNRQGWGRVVDVNNYSNSKILASANGDAYITGMYTHQSWFGGGGFIGTESNHSLFFITGYNPKMAILTNGNVLIGKTSQTNTVYKLDVAGKIRADEIVVNTTGADFVFEPTYKLRSLAELEAFIKTNKHLPEIAPAKEMQENGVSAGEMQSKLLQKVEELTLYMIEQQKIIEQLNIKVKEQDDRIKELENNN